MSSVICQHFTQNAWKRDLCSNCFKSKDEHKTVSSFTSENQKIDYAANEFPNKHKTPTKSIIKKTLSTHLLTAGTASSSRSKVSFHKQLHEVIGYGGEWLENDTDDDNDDDCMSAAENDNDENVAAETDDEETIELRRVTRANTDFNMNNGNLLGDARENIKKSFAALKLGAPQVDKEGNKQTLKINVMPFGAPSSDNILPATSTVIKAKYESKSAENTTSIATKRLTINNDVKKNEGNAAATATPATTATKIAGNQIEKLTVTATATATATAAATAIKKSTITSNQSATNNLLNVKTKATTLAVKKTTQEADGKNSPPIERAMEKSLLDEISETLEQKQNEAELSAQATTSKIKFELTSLSEAMENKPFLDLKKTIVRNPPITKEHTKPKVNVCPKYSDTDSINSDVENGVSAYYDVVETQISYENLPDGKYAGNTSKSKKSTADANNKQSVYNSSQYITDMLLSSKTRAASYNLHGGNFMTSKINSNGLIVTKCSSDDALDSTGSSFDGSSDEETNYNMTRSESDSGIGISIGNADYKNLNASGKAQVRLKSKLSLSMNNSSDYEDIQLQSETNRTKSAYPLDKCRELHGEPDGSADPDNSLEKNNPSTSQQSQLPALPKSPPPNKIDTHTDNSPNNSITASPAYGIQKQIKKPDLPVKPLVSPVSSPLKTFMAKRQPNNDDKQLVNQHQTNNAKFGDNINSDSTKDDAKLKKSRAPNPPPEQILSAPPTPEQDYNMAVELEVALKKQHEMTATIEQPVVLKSETLNNIKQNEAKAVELKAKTNETITEPKCATIKSTTINAPTIVSSMYARKATVATGNASSTAVTPVMREKDKRERATVNPKFRSLNTFMTQRSNATKNLQSATSVLNLKQSLTPEPVPRSLKNLSMSEECLAAKDGANLPTDKKSQPKIKTKFSIKKFLRMGSSSSSHQAKIADNMHKNVRDSLYNEINTGDDAGVAGKPRLVIIHPLDINPTSVEVVKDITKANDTSKPPAPPLRLADDRRAQDINKPARPPPPKSTELRRKQKIQLTATLSGSSTESGIFPVNAATVFNTAKTDNVYANLGEIRSSIAPRKPERTASMREREAQLEIARKQHEVAARNQNNHNHTDTISICSSNGENVSIKLGHNSKASLTKQTVDNTNALMDGVSKSSIVSRTSTFEQQKPTVKLPISKKLEIFEESYGNEMKSNADDVNNRPSSLKDSVRKINNTIDSYLKDKRGYENMYEVLKNSSISPPPLPPIRNAEQTGQRNIAAPLRRNNIFSDSASIASYSRSEYGPTRTYGLNNSLVNIPRIISTSYAGSEVGEFDIYAPYSYYGSDTGGDISTDINESVWGMPLVSKNRIKATNRLRMRKGRSVVHKNIEDNYTAVVVANHEALAQVLEQLQQTPIIPLALRPLANAINLRFEDFTIIDGVQAFVVGRKAFHAAIWSNAPVTLALSADCNQLAGAAGELSQLSGGISDVLNPITEFCDLVPRHQLPLMPSTENTMLQATISVLPRLQLDTLQTIGTVLKGKSQVLDKSNCNFRGSIPNLNFGKEGTNAAATGIRNVASVQNLCTLNEGNNENRSTTESEVVTTPIMPAFDDVMTREVAFIMLQLINGMKNLQVKAIEEMPLSLSNVVLSRDVENKDIQARLCVLQGANNNDEDEPLGTLCKCAYIALTDMLPATKITNILADILQKERAESLSKAKSVLEFILWGPSDVVLSGSTKERELALQRWLDLERATVLHGLVRTRVELTVYDECHLMFLVRSTAKMMNDAAKIVCSFQLPNNVAAVDELRE